MEGTIAVKSVLGEGTEFEVSLPIRSENQHGLTIHRVSNEKNVVIPSSLNDAISQTSDSSNLLGTPLRSAPNRLNNDEIPTILIADDNADVRIYISSILSSDYNLIFAKDGQECEELAFEHTPDLIILDVMMPFKDGFEVCKNLKTDDRTSHIPIIMLTAKADIDSKLEGLEQGADVYLMKPFNKEELLLRIKKLLELRHQLQKYYLSAINVGTGRDLSLNRTLHSNGDSKQTGSDVSPQNAFVQKLKSTIEKHLTDEDFDAVKLCREMTLSHSQLNRKLSALTGLAANAFIRYVRLIKAKELLLNSTYTINAIAYDCGFNDSSYFGRIFKQEFGETAQEWREKNIV